MTSRDVPPLISLPEVAQSFSVLDGLDGYTWLREDERGNALAVRKAIREFNDTTTGNVIEAYEVIGYDGTKAKVLTITKVDMVRLRNFIRAVNARKDRTVPLQILRTVQL